jgi:septal ring-binding cell division protein DamX
MKEQNEEGRVRFGLGRWTFSAFVGATLLISVVIFFLGVLVGQRLEADKNGNPEGPLLPIEMGELSKSGTSQAEDMTFYDVLGSKQSGGFEELKAPEGSVQDPKRQGESELTSRDKTAKKEETKVSVQAVPNLKEVERPDLTKPGGWTVQVNAFEEKRGADDLVRKLKKKGVDAYVMKVDVRGQIWFRVRAGHFDSKEKAKQLENRLKTEEKLLKAFATRIS